MKRRDFIRQTIHLAVCAGSLPVLDLATAWAAPSVPPIAVRKGTVIPQLVRDTLSAIGGVESVVRSGDVVTVKPNIGWDRRPEQAANTHPLVVKTLVELCLDAGAKRVLVFDHTCNDGRRCYQQSGIHDALKALGDKRVRLEQIKPFNWQRVAIKEGEALREWEFYRPALESDRYINVPVAKHHGLSTLSLAMKNTMGVIGGNRGRLHQNIGPALADINTVITSDLTVIDATRILIANGPQGGDLADVRQLDTLIASPDIVAADAHAATLFGYQPSDLETVVAGAQRGLGTMDLSKVDYR